MVEKIPAETRVGFRAYGHQSSRDAKNCKDSELLVPIKSIQKEEFNAKVDSLKPNGYTPIEYSLLEAKKDFEANPEFKKMIILVSDGKETCGGDPCKAVKVLKDIGFDLEVNAVGFSVDAETEKELKCIADATGGIYKNASNAEELVESLESYTKRAKMEYKGTGTEVTPGSGFVDAALIEAGEFSHDIQNGETHYYKFSVKKGQTLDLVSNGKNKVPENLGTCANTFKINLYDHLKSNRKDSSAAFYSSKVEPGTFEIRNYNVAKDGVMYATISMTTNAFEPDSDPRKVKCFKKPMFYELGLYLEGGEEAPTAPKESGPVE